MSPHFNTEDPGFFDRQGSTDALAYPAKFTSVNYRCPQRPQVMGHLRLDTCLIPPPGVASSAQTAEDIFKLYRRHSQPVCDALAALAERIRRGQDEAAGL